jgi:hypothetical protein
LHHGPGRYLEPTQSELTLTQPHQPQEI